MTNKMTGFQFDRYARNSEFQHATPINQFNANLSVIHPFTKFAAPYHIPAQSQPKTTNTIGLFLPQTKSPIFADPFYTVLIQSVARVCQDNNYAFLFLMPHALENDPIIFNCVASQATIDGLIVVNPQQNGILITQLTKQSYPIVVIEQPAGDHETNIEQENKTLTFNQSTSALGKLSALTLLDILNIKTK